MLIMPYCVISKKKNHREYTITYNYLDRKRKSAGKDTLRNRNHRREYTITYIMIVVKEHMWLRFKEIVVNNIVTYEEIIVKKTFAYKKANRRPKFPTEIVVANKNSSPRFQFRRKILLSTFYFVAIQSFVYDF